MAFDLEGYVDVADRITAFYAKYPDGRLTRLGEPSIMDVGGKLFVRYDAQAYRSPDDPVPAVGTAWEPFPGPTKFTRDSELMNAETSAWGRAIVAAGVPAKKIASRQEVQARQSDVPSQMPAPEPIGSNEAASLLLNADTAGIDRETLQGATVHITGAASTSSFSEDKVALAALSGISPEQLMRLGNWVERKRAEKTSEGTAT